MDARYMQQIQNVENSKKILRRILIALYVFIINKLFITFMVVIAKELVVNTELFTYENLKQVLFINFSRWDSNWYLNIVREGYYSVKSTAFFPLYPLLIRLIHGITALDYLYCGIIISNCSFLISLYYLQVLAELDFGVHAVERIVILVALNPVAFYFTAVYTEATFFMLTVLCLLNIRRRKWWIAALFGCFASATRNIGVLLCIPFAIEYLYYMLPRKVFQKGIPIKEKFTILAGEVRFRNIKKYFSILWGVVIASGLFAYMTYMYFAFGSAFTFIKSQGEYGRSSGNPITSIVYGLWETIKLIVFRGDFRIQFYYFLEAVAVIGFIAISVTSFKKMRFSYWTIMVISLLIPLAKPAITPTVTDYFVSFTRYAMVLYPYTIGWFMLTRNNKYIYRILISISVIFLQLNIYCWTLSYWVA